MNTDAQTLQSNIDGFDWTKIVPWWDQVQSWREKGPKTEDIHQLCKEMRLYFKYCPQAYSIEKYLWEKQILPRTYRRWKDKFKELQETHEYCLMGIGVRREEGALEFGLHAKTIEIVQPHYSEVWRLRERERAQLALETAQAAAKLAEATKEQEEAITRIKTIVSHAMDGVEYGFGQQVASTEVSTKTLSTAPLESSVR
jgi:hypothetical protein